jgi:glyoxylase I family protein
LPSALGHRRSRRRSSKCSASWGSTSSGSPNFWCGWRTTEHPGTSYELQPADWEGPIIELHTVEGEETPGINHIAFATDDIEEVTQTLKEEGVDQVSDPYHVEKTGRTITNFRDPDGRRFQAVSSEE